MTVGDVIQALWWQPVWLVLAIVVIIASGALLTACAAITLIESRDRTRP